MERSRGVAPELSGDAVAAHEDTPRPPRAHSIFYFSFFIFAGRRFGDRTACGLGYFRIARNSTGILTCQFRW